jgi:serine/threonine-protein kinase
LIGTLLSHFRIEALLGEGGMGAVYLAEDTNLDRKVALKVLPEAFTADEERLARFEREAKVLASLNHPNIAGIYEVGNAVPIADDGPADTTATVHYLVMELAEGEDLSAVMERGPLPAERAIRIAVQVAEALEAAHARGVIHRDLKPGNIKLTPDGQVKVLDFGLAKAWDPPRESSPELTHSPTLTAQMTQAGVILGTAAYMSPEQARGEDVDQRSDVWSFAVVLYEMLTGARLFHEPTVSDTLAAVLRADFDWNRLPADTPWRVRDLLRRCLERDARNRIHAIADARIELSRALDEPIEAIAPAIPTPASRGPLFGILPWALALILAGLLAWRWSASEPAADSHSDHPVRLEISLPAGLRFDQFDKTFALSPDGRRLVLAARQGPVQRLYLRDLASSRIEPIPGTENGTDPFFSHDGRWLGFTAVSQMKKVSLETSTVLPITEAEWGAGAWHPDGFIVYSPSYTEGLWRISADGGEPEVLTETDPERGELGHFWPDFLPGNEVVLFTNFKPPVEETRIEALDLTTLERHVVLEDAAHGRYLPSTGHLLFVRRETLFAAPFDVDEQRVTGTPLPLFDDVHLGEFQGYGAMEVSRDGTLVFLPASELYPDQQLVWVDRDGREEPVIRETRRYQDADISPDGTKIVVTIRGDSQDLWIVDLERDSLSRLTRGSATEFNGRWTPDGERILFNLDTPPFDQYLIRADGGSEPEPFLRSQLDDTISDITADGKVAFWQNAGETHRDLWVTSLEPGAEPRLFYRTPGREEHAVFSPDGRWIAYQGTESGQAEIYVQPTDGGARHQVSVGGGTRPMWSLDGSEIFYRLGDQFWAVPVTTAPAFRAGRPGLLFEATYLAVDNHRGYDIGPDGRFLFLKGPPGWQPRKLTVVLNVDDEIRRRTEDSGL